MGLPTPGSGAGAPGAPGPGWHWVWPGAGATWGWRRAQCRAPSSRGSAAWTPAGRAAASAGPRAPRGQARRAPGPGRRGGEGRAPGPLSLPGQGGLPRAREAAQEVEVLPKAVAARGRPARGRRGRSPRLLPEAQPPEGLEETVLHGRGLAAGARVPSPGVAVAAKAVVFVALRPCDRWRGGRSEPSPSFPPARPRRVGGGVRTWRAGGSGRPTAGERAAPHPNPPPTPPTLPPGALRPEGKGSPEGHLPGRTPGPLQYPPSSPPPTGLDLESEITLVDDQGTTAFCIVPVKAIVPGVCEHQHLAEVPRLTPLFQSLDFIY